MHEALQLIVLEKGQAQKMKLSGGKIFVITAGMMSENTAAHDLAMRDDRRRRRQSIFFVGYADPGFTGPAGCAPPNTARLSSSSPLAGRLTRGCDLQEFDLTAHANREELLEFVGQVSPRAVLLGHGDGPARNWFEEQHP